MFAGTFRTDNRVRTSQLKMGSSSTIAIPKHVEYGNTASEMLCGRFSVTASHVQHSAQTMRFAREIQIGCGVSRLGENALKLTITLFQFICFQVGFGSNEP